MRAGKEGPPGTKTLNSDLLPTPAPPPLGKAGTEISEPFGDPRDKSHFRPTGSSSRSTQDPAGHSEMTALLLPRERE